MNAPWRVEESPLTHHPVRQEGFFVVFSTSLHSGIAISCLSMSQCFVCACREHVEKKFPTCSLHAFCMANVLNASLFVYNVGNVEKNEESSSCHESMSVLTRARNKIKVQHKAPLKSSGKPLSQNTSTNQRVSKKFAESLKKVVAKIWQICCKAVILHPLSREKRRRVEILNKGTER